jgi:hypothetical protein
MIWTDGSEYKGHWVKGVQHGIGIMKFPNGKPRAGFFERNIFVLPLRDRKTIDILASELPLDLKQELEFYLAERQETIQNLNQEDMVGTESEYLESEQNILGIELKPNAVQMSEDEHHDKLQTTKNMAEVGKEVNPF